MPHVGQVLQFSLKELPVSQNRNGVRAAALVIFRDLNWVVRFCDHAGRWRRLFYFGNDAKSVIALLQRRAKIAKICSRSRLALQFSRARSQALDLRALGPQ